MRCLLDPPPNRMLAELEDRVRELEEQLAESQRRTRLLEELIEHAPVPIAIGHLEEGRTDPNAALRRRMDERALHTVEEVLLASHPDDRERTEQLLRQLLGGDLGRHVIDKRYVGADGRYDWERLSLSTRRIGDQTYTFAVLQDITELKRTEILLRTVGENMAVGCVVSSLETSRIRYVNPAMARMFGGDVDELVGALGSSFYEALGARTAMLQALRERGSLDGYEIWFRTGAGRRIRLSVSVRVVDYEGERCLMGTAVDISEGHLAKLELQRALDQRELLLQEIHHRVKNNLQVISSLLYLQGDAIREPRYKQLFESARLRVAAMATIHDALSASERARMPIDALVPRLADDLITAWSIGVPIELHCTIEPLQLPRDLVVPCVLVVNELVSNAIKHAFEGRARGAVAISFQAGADGSWVLCVEDDGVGIGDSEPSLGLTLVDALVRQLQATSTIGPREGGGTRCEIRMSDPSAATLARRADPK